MAKRRFTKYPKNYVQAMSRPKIDMVRPSSLNLDTEPYDTGYGTNITNYVWENTTSKLLNDAINRDSVSIFISGYPNGKMWWIEDRGISDRAFSALNKEMARLFPNSAYFYS